MLLMINMIGVLVFVLITVLISKDRKSINKRTVAMLLTLNLVVGWFFISFPIGREIILVTSEVVNKFISISYEGIAFGVSDWVNAPQMNFLTAALMPTLLILPFFNILTYFGILPFIIKVTGKFLSIVTRAPSFESFFAVEMMFLGNAEAIAVSNFQIKKLNPDRCLIIAMMSMSCISGSIIGAYIQMMPAEFILTAVPLNVINALLVTHILQPTRVSPEEDVIEKADDEEKVPFFAFLTDSILYAGKLIFIILCMVISFISLVKLVDSALAFINPALTLESILGLVMLPFAFLMGLDFDEAFQLAQFMSLKLVTNEFVVMLQVQSLMQNFSLHMQCVLTVFVTSFANIGTIGISLGAFKSVVSDEMYQTLNQNVKYLFISGVMVSLLSAGIAGLFTW